MVQALVGPACLGATVEHGVAGGTPGSRATYIAMGHLYFPSAEAFQEHFVSHLQAIVADVPNYTNVQPTVQLSEVKFAKYPAGAVYASDRVEPATQG